MVLASLIPNGARLMYDRTPDGVVDRRYVAPYYRALRRAAYIQLCTLQCKAAKPGSFGRGRLFGATYWDPKALKTNGAIHIWGGEEQS